MGTAPSNRPEAEPSVLGKALRLARPFWRSEMRWRALGLLVVTVALTLGLVWIEVRLNTWQGAFYDALQAKDAAAFWRLMLQFGGIAAAFVATAVWRQYLRQLLQLRWREWMTRRLSERWLAGGAHYRMQLGGKPQDNPDQRIADDTAAFVSDTLALSLGLLGSVVTLASFAGILWTLSGTIRIPLGDATALTVHGYLVWVALAYAAVGSWLTHRVGRPLPALQFEQQRVEADFRFGLARVREHGESVALQRGGAAEARAAAMRFGAVASNALRVMRRQKGLTGFTATYAQVAVVFPYLAAAPRYFAGGLTLGSLMQGASAFGQVQGALSWFVDAYAAIASWRATVERLWSFEQALARLDAAPTGPRASACGGDRIRTRGLRLSLPDGRALPMTGPLELRPGEWLLVEGASGAGKSTLLRAIAGLWPHGEGEVELPREAPHFVPQKSYLPIGTLRDVLAYPNPADGLDDDAALGLLSDVGLDALADALDVADAWHLRLSPGEQQRIALARVLHARPRWLLLDEATSALDPAAETRLYGLLRERLSGAAVVSVAHRSALRQYHDRRLVLGADAPSMPSSPSAPSAPAATTAAAMAA